MIMNMNIKIKKIHPNATIPVYAKPGDAGLDLTCTKVEIQDNIVTYKTGLCMEIPVGYVGLLFPRSSVYKHEIQLSNSVGVIDSGYRGEIMFKYRLINDGSFYIEGERVGQILILPYPKVQFTQVETLSESDRGTGGYGSTGK